MIERTLLLHFNNFSNSVFFTVFMNTFIAYNCPFSYNGYFQANSHSVSISSIIVPQENQAKFYTRSVNLCRLWIHPIFLVVLVQLAWYLASRGPSIFLGKSKYLLGKTVQKKNKFCAAISTFSLNLAKTFRCYSLIKTILKYQFFTHRMLVYRNRRVAN